MISRDTLDGFFEHSRLLKKQGKARFDIDQVCRWSFFMVDSDREKLIPVGRYLEDEGYQIVEVLDPDPKDLSKTFFLRFDRVEKHTVDSLFARNLELYRIAARYGVEYDGMDVGSIIEPGIPPHGEKAAEPGATDNPDDAQR